MTSFSAAPPSSCRDGALARPSCRHRSIICATLNGNLETYKRGENAKLKLQLRRRTAVHPPRPFVEDQPHAGVRVEELVRINRVAHEERVEPRAVLLHVEVFGRPFETAWQ